MAGTFTHTVPVLAAVDAVVHYIPLPICPSIHQRQKEKKQNIKMAQEANTDVHIRSTWRRESNTDFDREEIRQVDT